MKDMKLSDEQALVVIVFTVACFIGGLALGAYAERDRRYWVSEPYEPTIKITIENGVHDTTYGYSLDKILEK